MTNVNGTCMLCLLYAKIGPEASVGGHARWHGRERSM